jgi:hypothetical protein
MSEPSDQRPKPVWKTHIYVTKDRARRRHHMEAVQTGENSFQLFRSISTNDGVEIEREAFSESAVTAGIVGIELHYYEIDMNAKTGYDIINAGDSYFMNINPVAGPLCPKRKTKADTANPPSPN